LEKRCDDKAGVRFHRETIASVTEWKMRTWYAATRDMMLAGLMVVAGTAPGIAAPADPSMVVSGLNGDLLKVMQNAQKLGYKGRYAALEPVVRQVFDISYMTRIAVGSGWSTLSDEQQAQLTEAFRKFITATYALRFDGYSGEKFVTDGARPVGQATLVATRLIKSDGEPVALSYLTREDPSQDGHWQVVDIYLTGTISEMATRRSEFAAVFSRSGYAGLLQALQQKVAQIESDSHLS
jgi:phospholipid transport system substrate-binding protein